jgi:hypothetical protein
VIADRRGPRVPDRRARSRERLWGIVFHLEIGVPVLGEANAAHRRGLSRRLDVQARGRFLPGGRPPESPAPCAPCPRIARGVPKGARKRTKKERVSLRPARGPRCRGIGIRPRHRR